MQQIRVLGRALEPEFSGGLGNASSLINLEVTERGLHKPDPAALCEIVWTFESAGGERGVYLEYASPKKRPCRLVVNGEVVLKTAAFDRLFATDWRYQGLVMLQPGTNRVALQTPGELAEIKTLAFAEPPVTPHPSVDDCLEHLLEVREAKRGPAVLKLQPARLAGLVELFRELSNDEGSAAKLEQLIPGILFATHKDSVNGQFRLAWGGPLNAQTVRQQILRRLMRLGIDAIVETGTYIGASTAFFARQGVPVFSCELNERYFASAVSLLCDCKDVTLYLDDSRSFLGGLAADPAFGFGFPLFYLDAHWNDDLPLADEIAIIRARWPRFVIMVDDFQVPESDYLYDSYPNGLELTLGYLERQGVDLGDLAVLFPTASAEVESGQKRGTLVLMPAEIYEQRMATERTLYRYRPGAGA